MCKKDPRKGIFLFRERVLKGTILHEGPVGEILSTVSLTGSRGTWFVFLLKRLKCQDMLGRYTTNLTFTVIFRQITNSFDSGGLLNM